MKKRVSSEITWQTKWQTIPHLKHLVKKLHSAEGKGEKTEQSKEGSLMQLGQVTKYKCCLNRQQRE